MTAVVSHPSGPSAFLEKGSQLSQNRPSGEENYRYSVGLDMIETWVSSDPVQDRLIEELGVIEEIDAVFVHVDERGAYHIYSVIREHESKLYEKIMKKEERIQNAFTETTFDFRVRAHQGRRPSAAVPLSSRPVYLR